MLVCTGEEARAKGQAATRPATEGVAGRYFFNSLLRLGRSGAQRRGGAIRPQGEVGAGEAGRGVRPYPGPSPSGEGSWKLALRRGLFAAAGGGALGDDAGFEAGEGVVVGFGRVRLFVGLLAVGEGAAEVTVVEVAENLQVGLEAGLAVTDAGVPLDVVGGEGGARRAGSSAVPAAAGEDSG